MANGFWHLDPANPRTFDIALAKQKLETAGYRLDTAGKRLDKENKPISLRMLVPDSSTTYAQSAEFITAWWKELGIDVTTQSLDQDTVTARETPPGRSAGQADFDVVIWNWAGTSIQLAARHLTTDQVGSNNDTFFSNALRRAVRPQGKEQDQRKAYIDEMQQLAYDQAPYHILFCDAALHATEPLSSVAGNRRRSGLPFFAYGTPTYDLSPRPRPTPSPSAAASAGLERRRHRLGDRWFDTSGGNTTLLLLGGVALVVVAVAGVWAVSRRRNAASEEE
jgi:peptide/nickel transport system substrate-binding protein